MQQSSQGDYEISNLPPIKTLRKRKRGAYEEWETNVDGVRVTAVKWFDNRCVHTLSTFARSKPLVPKIRYDRHAKERKNK